MQIKSLDDLTGRVHCCDDIVKMEAKEGFDDIAFPEFVKMIKEPLISIIVVVNHMDEKIVEGELVVKLKEEFVYQSPVSMLSSKHYSHLIKDEDNESSIKQ